MASLARYLIRRAIQGVITLFIVTVVVFILFYFSGNPLKAPRPYASSQRAAIERLKQQYRLDQGPEVQLYRYVINMFTFTFGYSTYANAPVVTVLQEALPRTLFLFGGAVFIEYIIGILVGRYIAWKRGRGVEGGVILTSLFFYNMPSFWIGLILLFTFAYVWKFFPLRGFQDTPTDSFTALHYPFLLSLQCIAFEVVLGVIALLAGAAIIALAWIRRPKRPLETLEQAMRLVPGAVVAGLGAVLFVWPFWNMSTFDVADILIHGS